MVCRYTPKRAAGLLLITVVATTLQSLVPYLVGQFVDQLDGVNADELLARRDQLYDLFWLLVFAWLAGPFVQRLYTALNAFTMPRMRAGIDTELFAWTLRQSKSFFENSMVGSLTQQIRKAGQASINLFESFVLPFACVATTLAVFAFLFFITLPGYGLAFVGFAVAFVVVSLVLARWVGRIVSDLAAARSRVSGRIADTIGAHDVVRSFAAEADEVRQLQTLVEEEYRRGRDARLYFTVMRVAQLVLSVGFMSVVVWHALGEVIAGRLTPGNLVMMLTIGVQLALTINDLGDNILSCFEYVGDLQESLDALVHPIAITSADGAALPERAQGGLTLDKVSFRYPDGKQVFRALSVTVAPGEKVGIVGRSGAGKTTLLRLITRQYDLERGHILLDDRDIRELTLQGLKHQLSEVSQSAELFHRTILENIRYARPGASDDEVMAAAKAALCHDFIMARDGGYQAVVGERGVKLSGGERQRIAIARAILKQAPILLLDEATSALDSQSEREIQRALETLMTDRTVIAVAHRLSTLAGMNRILVLENGAVIEEGSHEALLAQRGAYARLWEMQSEGYLATE
ncbi:ABC transporter ATP-binding protein [Marinobacter sp. NSM]|uniref:ABC transporter ATP-binding protein n=1 Tax=Marinobacter sp. NSM TaxID=3458004 RepID=UPI0040357FED